MGETEYLLQPLGLIFCHFHLREVFSGEIKSSGEFLWEVFCKEVHMSFGPEKNMF